MALNFTYVDGSQPNSRTLRIGHIGFTKPSSYFATLSAATTQNTRCKFYQLSP